MAKHPQLTTLVEFESKLTRKLKASYRSKPEKSPELYYHIIMRVYADDKHLSRFGKNGK
jgi:hypothetical protein